MINPNPTCEKLCKFISQNEMTTLIGWTPVYDKFGKQLNRDPNTTKKTVCCLTCGKQWYLSSTLGVTTIEASKYNVE